jgi:hypothetical protein
MQDPRSSVPHRSVRRLVLGAAFAAGLFAALVPRMETVRAADLPDVGILVQADTATGGARSDPATEAGNAAAARAAPTPDAAPAGRTAPTTDAASAAKATPAPKAGTSNDENDEDADASDADADASKDHVAAGKHGIFIDEGGRKIRIEGLGRDREYDSFQQFVQEAPWLAGLVFFSVLLVFLVPLLIIVLLIWYKIRKNRMANETMLKLAERGVVSPAAAMDAVASGTAPSVAAAAAAPPPGYPAYEHARYLRRRTVWSDLRKGIILTGVGLGLTFFSMLDDGTPNSIGLILLFVGLGYCLLWFFEDRTTEPPRQDTRTTPPPGGA